MDYLMFNIARYGYVVMTECSKHIYTEPRVLIFDESIHSINEVASRLCSMIIKPTVDVLGRWHENDTLCVKA